MMLYSEIGGRYIYKADVFGSTTNIGTGEWETYQDPLTGELTTRPIDVTKTKGTPTTIWCQVTSIIDGGIRVAGTTEVFNQEYVNSEYLRMVFPKKYAEIVTKRSRVTNIRDRHDNVIWKNEENGGEPTEFTVEGPSPVNDPFGNMIEIYTLLKRSEVQNG